MADEIIKIDTIQFKRGTESNLNIYLKGANMPKQGELIYELPDTINYPAGRFKIGTGNTDWVDSEDHSKGQKGDYINLPYQANSVDFSKWMQDLNQIKTDTEQSAANAKTEAELAEGYKNNAATSAAQAEATKSSMIEAVENYMDTKFVPITLGDYNALTELNPKSIYCITLGTK